jgi:anti-sigma B factor antagonist
VEIDVRSDGSALVVSVTGRIDTLSSSEFQKRMEELLEQAPQQLVLDLCRLEYVSSAGLRSIIVITKKIVSQGGKLACCALQPVVRDVFEVSGINTKIPVFDSVNEATVEMK